MVMDTTDRTTSAVLQEVSQLALERAVENGARRETLSIAEMEALPLQVCTCFASIL